MPVVPTFPNGEERHKGVLGRLQVFVVRMVTVNVCGAIDQPGEMEHDSVPKKPRHP